MVPNNPCASSSMPAVKNSVVSGPAPPVISKSQGPKAVDLNWPPGRRDRFRDSLSKPKEAGQNPALSFPGAGPTSLMSWLSHQTVTAGTNDGANSETLSGFRLIPLLMSFAMCDAVAIISKTLVLIGGGRGVGKTLREYLLTRRDTHRIKRTLWSRSRGIT